MQRFGMSMLWFWVCYIAVTCVGILHCVFKVVIPHPWSLSFKEFYVRYQPHITLIYIIIFLAPVIGFAFTQL